MASRIIMLDTTQTHSLRKFPSDLCSSFAMVTVHGNFEGLGGFVLCVFARVGTSKNSFKVQEEKARQT